MEKEFLITGQGYLIKDVYKQSIILYDAFYANSEEQAKNKFKKKFQSKYHIMNIYSIIDLQK
jgi:hypothetical protein